MGGTEVLSALLVVAVMCGSPNPNDVEYVWAWM